MKIKRKIGILGRIALSLLIMLSAGVVVYAVLNYETAAVNKQGKNKSFNTGWAYLKNGKYIDIKENLPTDADVELGDYLILRNTLPKITKENNTLKFKSSNQTVKVTVDGEVIYTFGTDETREFGKTPGSVWNFVELDESCSGKIIHIELLSEYEDCVGFVSNFNLGDKAEMILDMIKSNIFGIVLGLFMVLIGITFVFRNYFTMRAFGITNGYVYLGIFGICLGMWSLLDTGIIHILYGYASVLTLVTFYCLMFVPIMFIMFLYKTVLGKYYRTVLGLMIISAVNIILQTILQLTGYMDLYEMVPVTHIIIVCSALAAIILVIREYIIEKKREQKLFLNALLVVTIAGIAEMIVYYNIENIAYSTIIQISMIVMILLLGRVNSLRINEITERSIKAEMFEKLAYEDILTGLKNRTYFEKEMKRVDANIEDYRSIAIVSLDMNNLKYYNDTFGHNAGDEMLCSCAECLSGAFSDMGTIARIGGDEYSIILTDVEEEKIKKAIEKMHMLTEQASEKEGHRLSVACGYAYYDKDIDKNMESVLIRADKKMYENKAEIKAVQKGK